MKPIPLITSFPPTMRRHDSSGREIGRDYGLKCIKSWRDSGFEPVSVNASDEIAANTFYADGVAHHPVDSHAGHLVGKPLVYIRDMLGVARSLTDGPVALTNADVILDLDQSTREMIGALTPGNCMVAKRIDIRSPETRRGAEYRDGYDFFAFHSRDLDLYTDDEFVFGVPWWDHYLPIIMSARGVKLHAPPGPLVYHLDHTERWDVRLWTLMGERFLAKIHAELDARTGPEPAAGHYADQIARAVAGDETLWQSAKGQFRISVMRKQETRALRGLRRVNFANIRYIDALRDG